MEEQVDDVIIANDDGSKDVPDDDGGDVWGSGATIGEDSNENKSVDSEAKGEKATIDVETDVAKVSNPFALLLFGEFALSVVLPTDVTLLSGGGLLLGLSNDSRAAE